MRQRERYIDRQRESWERERGRERERVRQRERYIERQRESWERENVRGRERQRGREREKKRETERQTNSQPTDSSNKCISLHQRHRGVRKRAFSTTVLA